MRYDDEWQSDGHEGRAAHAAYQQMTLPNGTVVMPDGTVKMANGTTRMLKNDECVYMDGTMGKMGNMNGKRTYSDRTMQMGKDSTKM